MAKVGSKPGNAAHTAGKSYADPGYQSDGLKRYALDSPGEVRAALRYIGMPKNSSKYSSGDLAKVKGAIYRAAKRYGIDAYKSVADNATKKG